MLKMQRQGYISVTSQNPYLFTNQHFKQNGSYVCISHMKNWMKTEWTLEKSTNATRWENWSLKKKHIVTLSNTTKLDMAWAHEVWTNGEIRKKTSQEKFAFIRREHMQYLLVDDENVLRERVIAHVWDCNILSGISVHCTPQTEYCSIRLYLCLWCKKFTRISFVHSWNLSQKLVQFANLFPLTHFQVEAKSV